MNREARLLNNDCIFFYVAGCDIRSLCSKLELPSHFNAYATRQGRSPVLWADAAAARRGMQTGRIYGQKINSTGNPEDD
jgi:hypothetical protein